MNKKYLFVTGFLVILTVVGGVLIFSTNKNPETKETPAPTESSTPLLPPSPSASPSANIEKAITMDNGLIIQDETLGTGVEATVGKKITVNYTGTLINGTKFDSSLNPGRTPFSFTLGAGEVIKGWDEGFAGMKVGGKRKLTIPPALGYGSNDTGLIPPNSTLIFEVELLNVE